MGFQTKYVTCQRGGVSNKLPVPTGSDKTGGQGSFGPLTGGLKANLAITTQKKFKRKTDHTLDPFH